MAEFASFAANLYIPSGFPYSTYPGTFASELSDHQCPSPGEVPVLIILNGHLASDREQAFVDYLNAELPAGAAPSDALKLVYAASLQSVPWLSVVESGVERHFASVANNVFSLAVQELDEALQYSRSGTVGLVDQVPSPPQNAFDEPVILFTRSDWAVAEVQMSEGDKPKLAIVFYVEETKLPALSNAGGALDGLMRKLERGWAYSHLLDRKEQVLLVKLVAAALALRCHTISLFDGRSYVVGEVIPHPNIPKRHNLVISPKVPFAASRIAQAHQPAYLTLLLSTAYPGLKNPLPDRLAQLVAADPTLRMALSSTTSPPNPFKKPSESETFSGGIVEAGEEMGESRIVEVNDVEGLLTINTLMLRYPDQAISSPFHRLYTPSSLTFSPESSPLASLDSPEHAALSSRSPRPAILPLDGIAGRGGTAVAYWHKFPSGEVVVAKESRRGCAAAQEWEIGLLDRLRDSAMCVKVYGVFGRGEGKEARYVVLMEGAGTAVRKWSDLAVRERQVLLFDLLRLHVRARTLHGDARPANALVDRTALTMRRPVHWIDIVGEGTGDEHIACGVLNCEEVVEVAGNMALTELDLKEVEEMAWKEGLLAESGMGRNG
ncbi:hypothetical protein JCM11251_003001 [Rhodosporidiobolus azoricus]